MPVEEQGRMTKKQGADDVVEVVTELVVELDEVEVPEGILRRIPAKVRGVIYEIGTWLGFGATIAPALAALLTGEAQSLVFSLGGLALALSNMLAKANLKP